MKAERKDIDPKCPYCEARIEHVVVVKAKSWREIFADQRVCCCPECEKILGVAN